MHGHSPGSALLANAEVDSMGGVVDGGLNLDTKASPRRAAIEKAQAELRQEFDVREERRRELEFLEKGGNPLDFKLGPATSISVQSTSLTDQIGEQYVVSEAKGSFALAASPHGDSVDSSGRPGPTPARDPNSADNILLLDGENDVVKADRNSTHPSKRSKIVQSERSSQLVGSLNAKESEDSAGFRLGKSQAYARRNRSRTPRDSGHVNAADLGQSGHGNGTSLVVSSCRRDLRDAKGSLCESQKEKEPTGSSFCHSKTTSPNGNVAVRTPASENQLDMEVDAVQAPGTSAEQVKVGLPEKGLGFNEKDEIKSSEVGLEKDSSAAEEQVQAGQVIGEADIKDKYEKNDNADQPDGCSFLDNGANVIQSPFQNKENGFSTPKGIDSESSSLERVINGDQCFKSRKVNDSTLENSGELMIEKRIPSVDSEVEVTKDHTTVDVNGTRKDDHVIAEVKMEDNVGSRSDHQTEVESNGQVLSKSDRKLDTSLGDESNSRKASSGSQARSPSHLVLSNGDVVNAVSFEKEAATTCTATCTEVYNTSANNLKIVDQADEDVVLEKARIIEANRKRLGVLSVSSFRSEKQKKSHWDFVLEEMAWLANDFMQERLWKTTCAAQMSHWVAFGGLKKFNEENLHRKQKEVARTLAKAVIQFWKSAEVVFRENPGDDCNSDVSDLQKVHVHEAIKDRDDATIMQKTSDSSQKQRPGQENLAVQGYAVRFLKFISSSSDLLIQAEAPTTPDRISDAGILEISWEDQLSEESLFYTIPAGAMADYRKSVESLWAEYEKIGDSARQEECEVSLMDSVSEYGAQDNPFEEEEGETGSYYLPGVYEGIKSSKFIHKKKKNLPRSYSARSYEVAHELPYRHNLENRLGSQQVSMGKRPSSTLNVGSIPTKRVRTAARQRVVGPFIHGGLSGAQVASKTDASSGDTSSLQDDQSSLHGGSHLRKNSEVESTGEFGKQFPFDGADTSPKTKKKKKSKHLVYRNSLNSAESGGFILSGKGSTFDQTFQLDGAQHEQRDLSKRKLENHQFESNGSTGVYGPHSKKPKLLKQVSEASPEALGSVNGSLPSPVASHIGNMSNPNKLIRMIANRAPGRKVKGLKIISPSGSGSPWSNLEDQALVVLVHDMGPNWELVSDAMNSSLHFKCTFRKPKECKERHKILMDQNSGDGADSVEDSGSSQPYPSTLPGIPKGSARQLFQHLQGPMEEDMLKAHFEKIILIGKHLHLHKIKNENQEGKQLTPVHSSHFHALSQVCSNNSNIIPTPLDFCDAPASSPDVLSLGYQGSHPNSLAIPNNQGSVGTVLPTSGASSMIQGTSGMVLGNGVPSSSAALNPSPRDSHRFGVPRPTSLPMDEQQRLQQYSQMISGRNIQQPAMSNSGAMQVGNDRGVRMLPGGNGMGMMCGMNRSMGMPRPGFQGMGSPGMLNMVSSGGMISSSGVGMPSPVNMHTGPISGQTNSMLRPRDTLTMMRPGQNAEDQRHLMMQDLQMQVPQANGQAVSTHFNSLSTAYTNQTVASPVQSFPVQHPPQHQMAQQPHVLNSPHHPHLQSSNSSSPQQQAYAFRLAKERHLQQRLMHQQQHQFTSTAPSQHPVSPMQNGSSASGSSASLPLPNTQQSLAPSSSPMSPMSSHVPAKHAHSLSRNPPPTGTLPNQMLKQRQRQQQLQQQQQQQQQQQLQQQQQQHQQRPHPQSRQQSHSQQQPKNVKGLGRGSSVMMHQNLTVDSSHSNGLSPGSQISEKGEPAMHLMQNQGLYTAGGTGSTIAQPGKQLAPQLSNPSAQQQKLFPRATKQHPQISSHMDSNNQGQVAQVTSNQPLLPTQQTVPSSPLSRQASQPQQSMQASQPQQSMQASQPQQSMQRMLPQSNRQSTSSDASVPGPADQGQTTQVGPNSAVSQCTDAPNIGHSVSSATSPSQWKAEPMLYDTSVPVVQLASVGNSPQTSSTGSELGPQPSQPMVQRQLSGGSMAAHGNNISGQWQQQSQTPPQPQQPQQQQQQKSQHLQQQQRHAQGNLYARTSNTGQG